MEPNNIEVPTDFTINSSLNSGLFVLRDFVNYGDAIRIKLPHLQDDPDHSIAKNQYLWIENHQRLTTFDHSQHEEEVSGCKEATLPGMWAFIQVGKDIKDNSVTTIHNNSSANHPNSQASWIFPLTAEGNYDFKYDDLIEAAWIHCLWNNKSVAIDKSDPSTLPNPFIGYSDIFNFFNSDGNDILSIEGGDSYQPGTSEKINGNIEFNQHARGDREDAYSFTTGKTKISLSNNPAPTPVYTYLSPGILKTASASNQHTLAYENRSIWLNGISVEILQENYDPSTYGQGAILVKVRFDEYEVNQPVRWCGNIKVSPNDFDATPADFSDNMYALNVMPGGSILLDRSRSYTRHHAVDQNPTTNEYRFSEPTEMTILPNAYFHMEGGTSMVVDGESTLRVSGNSRLEIHEYGNITVKKGSKLIIENNAQVVLWDNAFIKVEQGGILEYDNSFIELLGDNSVIEFEGTLSIADNADFTFTGDGYVKFSRQGFINPITNPSNLIIGTGSTITLNGTGANDKVLEVTQESLYAFAPLAKFTLTNGLAALGNNSRICVDGDLLLQNATITSATGTYNQHRGFNIFGQSGVSISNCTFEHGKYGMYSLQTSGGNPLTLTNCIFRLNDYGLVTVDKGVTFINCDFIQNAWGWQADGLTFPSTVKSSHFNSNAIIGINYFGTGTTSLLLQNTNVNLNEFNGIVFHSPSMLTISCGSVFNNENYGIYISNNGILNTSPQVAPYGGKVNLTSNFIGIYADCANNWFTVGGRNNFTSDFAVARGSFNQSCNYTIPANFNRWKNALTGPVINTDFKLKGCGCPPNQNILLNDPNAINQLFCPAIWNTTPSQKNLMTVNNPIEHCPGCEVINTSDFQDKKLNEAVEYSIAFTEFGKDSLTGNENDLTAINLFSQILTYRYNNGDKFNRGVSEREGWLLELSNQKMKEALGNAYLNGKISGTSNTELTKVITALDSVYSREKAMGKHEKAFYAIVDKASVYKLAGDREKALYELNNIASCILLDSVQQAYLTKLTNLIFAEEQLLTGKIKKEDFAKYLDNLNLTNTIVSGFEIENSPDDSLFAQVYFTGDTLNFTTRLPYNEVTWSFGDCTNGTGSNAAHIYNEPGKYIVTCQANTSCSSHEFTSVIIVLPDYDAEMSSELENPTCDKDEFSLNGRILVNSELPSCSTTGFVPIENNDIRFFVEWDFDLPSRKDTSYFVAYQDAINSIGEFQLMLFKGNASKINTAITLQYFIDGIWKNTKNYFLDTHEIIPSPKFMAVISFDSLVCQLDSMQFQSVVTGGFTPYDYEWHFDNGVHSHIANPKVVFEYGGTHNVKVLIKDSLNCIAEVDFPQGFTHAHFDLQDSLAQTHHHSEFDFNTLECSTIHGFLSSFDPCFPLNLSNVTLELINENRQFPVTPVVTDLLGRFQFKPSEVAGLESSLLLMLNIRRPKEYFMTERIIGYPSELISSSPIQVFINSTKINEIRTRTTSPFETNQLAQITDNLGNQYSISTVNSSTSQSDFYIEKRNTGNILIWSQNIDYAFSQDSVTSFCLDSLGNAYIVGTTWNGTDHDIFIVKVNSDGEMVWSCIYEDSIGTEDIPLHICLDSGFVCVSTQNITSSSVTKFSNILYEQCLSPETRNNSFILPDSSDGVEDIFSIYPNPNSSQTLFVNYEAVLSDEMRLVKIYNLDGKLLYQSQLKPGLNEISINLVSGIYPCMFTDQNGKIQKVEKLVYMR